MSKIVIDEDNPEWTAKDFATAKGPETLPAHILAAFPATKVRGRPKKPDAKVQVSLRLSPDVLGYYKSQGAGWQAEVEKVLAANMCAQPRPASIGADTLNAAHSRTMKLCGGGDAHHAESVQRVNEPAPSKGPGLQLGPSPYVPRLKPDKGSKR